MFRKKKAEQKDQQPAEKKIDDLLKAVFDLLPRKVELLLFTGPGRNEPYCEAARKILGPVAALSEKIGLQEFDIKHELAAKYKIQYTPTLLIDPDHVHIRWLGAPLGREIEPFFQVLNMVGHQKSGLGDQALKVLKSIGEPRQIKIFVSLTCPYCPQEVRNAIQAAVERPDIISLEIIDVEAVPELADRYNAFGTPIVYTNEKLIAKGSQSEELFMISLKKLEEVTIFIPDNDAEQIETDLVIVGGGPAGLTAGIYAARSGLKSVVVEKGALDGQVATTPVVENYPGLTKVGGKALVDIMVLHALEYANIFPGEEVMDIKPGQPIMVTTNRRRFLTRVCITRHRGG